MKIVVLAGGLSPERNVSLSSGTMIAEALRSRGHRAALVDLYFGLEDYNGPTEAYFDAPLSDAGIRDGYDRCYADRPGTYFWLQDGYSGRLPIWSR